MRRAIALALAALVAFLFFLQRRASVPTAPAVDEPASASEAPALSMPEELGVPATTVEPASERMEMPATDAAREAVSAQHEPAAAPAPALVTVHGQVVDARSGVPVPGEGVLGVVRSPEHEPDSFAARLFAHSGTRLGPQGTFELTTRAPDELAASVVIWSSGQELEHRVRHRYAGERQPDGTWRLPVEIGWFVRLELDAPGRHKLRLQGASLVESAAGEESRRQVEVWGPDPAFVLHRAAAFEPHTNHRRWLEVSADDGEGEEWSGRIEIERGNGVEPEPLHVSMHQRISAQLRLVDESGEPWASAHVAWLPDGESSFAAGLTDLQGEVELHGLVPGRNRLRVTVPFTPAHDCAIDVAAGEDELNDLVVPRQGPRGAVSGELDACKGSDERSALVFLRDPRTGAEQMQIAFFEEPALGRAPFEFAEVPPGRYELDVWPLGGWRYRGLPLRIDAPRADIVIEMEPHSAARNETRFEDAETRAMIRWPSGAVLRGERWIPFWWLGNGSHVFTDESVALIATGYRPLLLRSEQSSATSATPPEVLLERGWGRIVIVRDLGVFDDGASDFSGRPLADVRVLADGSEVARSDGAGLALVALEHEPATLSCELSGHRIVSSKTREGVQLVRMQRER